MFCRVVGLSAVAVLATISAAIAVIVNGDFSAGLAGWAVRGPVAISGQPTNAAAFLDEDEQLLDGTTLYQDFEIPPGAGPTLRFTFAMLAEESPVTDTFIPDAFLASLLDPNTLGPLLDTNGFVDFFAVEFLGDLEVFAVDSDSGLVTTEGDFVDLSTDAAFGIGGTVVLDLSQLAAGTRARIDFTLAGGFDGFHTSVIVDDVVLSVAGCGSDAECDDLDPCTEDTCQGTLCVNQPLPDCNRCANDRACDDGNACTDDICELSTRGRGAHATIPRIGHSEARKGAHTLVKSRSFGAGICRNMPRPPGTSCSDDVFCNGAEMCNDQGRCETVGVPCVGGGICHLVMDACIPCDTEIGPEEAVVCHRDAEAAREYTILVPDTELGSHLKHGDSIGPCASDCGLCEFVVVLDDRSQGEQCVEVLRPRDVLSGFPAMMTVTARTGISHNSPKDPLAAGVPGSVRITALGAGVRRSKCTGSDEISGAGPDADEELIIEFDAPVTLDDITIRLKDIDFIEDQPVIFISEPSTPGYEYVVLEHAILGAFTLVDFREGLILFSRFLDLPSGLTVDKLKIRETNGGHTLNLVRAIKAGCEG